MALKVGELYAALELDKKGFDTGLDQAEQKGNSFVGGFTKAAGVAVAGAVAGVAVGLVASFNAAADFEKAISAVGAVAGATKAELDGLAETGLRIGKETAFSATEAAAAMEVLAANGVSVKDIMGGAADAAVALAAAGGTDLVTAADLASTSMAVWGLKTADMTDVVNRMAGAANVSRFGVEDMALAVAQGGGAAASAGIEFGDFTTAIAAIAPSFSSGSDAGTSFKQFVASLTPTALPAKKAMRELGLITAEAGNRFYDAEGNIKSMAEISDILNVATRDLSEQQKAQALETIFGSDAMRAAAALAKINGTEFANMDRIMRESDAAAVAAARLDNASGAMEALRGTIEVLQITIGMKLTPVIQALALWLSDVLPVAFEAAWGAGERFIGFIKNLITDFLSLVEHGSDFKDTYNEGMWADVVRGAAKFYEVIRDQVMPVVRDVAGVLREVLMPVIERVGAFLRDNKEIWAAFAIVVGTALVIAFGALAVSAGAAAISIIAATLPIIAIAVAVTALVAGIIWLVKNWDMATERVPLLGAAVDGFIGLIKQVPGLIDAVAEAWRTHVAPVLAEAVEKLRNDVFPVLERFGDLLETVWKVWFAAFKREVQIVLAVVKATWDEMAQVFLTTFALIFQIVETGIELIRDTISIVMALIRGDWDGAWNGIKTLVSNVWENIKELTRAALDTLKARLDLAWALIKVITDEAWKLIKDLIAGAWAAIDGIVLGATAKVKATMDATWSAIKASSQAAWDAVKASIAAVLTAITDALSAAGVAIQTGLDKLKAAIQATWDAVKAATATAWEAIKLALAATWAAINLAVDVALAKMKAALQVGWDAIKAAAALVWDGIRFAIDKEVTGILVILGKLKDIGTQLVRGFLDGAKSLLGEILRFFFELPGKIVRELPDPLRYLYNIGKQMIQGLINGIRDMIGGVAAAAGAAVSAIPDAAKKILKIFSPSRVMADIGMQVGAGLASGIKSSVGRLVLPEVALTARAIPKGLASALSGGAMPALARSGSASPASAMAPAQYIINITAPNYIGPESALIEPVKRTIRELERTNTIRPVLR